MKYFLIDTNVWIEILSEGKSGDLLDKFYRSVLNGKVKCLIPKTVEKEWKKNKTIHLDEVKMTYKRIMETFTHKGSNTFKPAYTNEVSMTKKKIAQIDEILSLSIRFKISDEVMVKAVKCFEERKAPFHHKESSMNDAMIYYSSIEYLKMNGIADFVFITRNTSDFSEPNLPNKLHPDLIVEGISCDYYQEIGKAFHIYKDDIAIGEVANIYDEFSKYQITVFEKGNLSLLKHLHRVLKHIKELINFIPTSILARAEPFRINNPEWNYSYYSNFRLHINNEDLFKLFEQMNIEATVLFKPDSEYSNNDQNCKMATEIIQMLNENSVYEIESVITRKTVYIQLESNSECECASCCYLRMEFTKALNAAKNKQEAIEDRFKAAFVYFSLEKYNEAGEVLVELLKVAKSKDLRIVKFRVLYNLYWLKSIGDLQYDLAVRIDREAGELDLKREYFQFALSPGLEEAIAAYYHNTDFVLQYSDSIYEITDKINEHFELQLNGGYSTNSNYENLLCTYGEYEMFVRANSLLFFKFSNHQRIFSKVSNALLKIQSFNKYQPGKLVFNDYHLMQFIHYGDAGEIGKRYNSLSRKLIEYEEEGASNFKTYIKKFLTELSFSERQTVDADLRIIQMPYEKLFVNIIVLSTIVDFNKGFVTGIAESVYECLLRHKLRPANLEQLGWYFSKVRPLLSKQLQKRYFDLFLTNADFHDRDLFYCFKSTAKEFVISDADTYSIIESTFMKECAKCKQYHTEALYSLSNLLSPALRRKLRNSIGEKLSLKFDPEQYYYFSIHEVINYKMLFSQYLMTFPPISGKVNRRSFFNDGEIIYHDFSNLLNLVFKNRIVLPTEFVESHRGISDYYDWILGIDQYDYEKFDPLWILQYATRFYLKHIFQSTKVKEKVRIYLKNNYQPTLAKYYASYVR